MANIFADRVVETTQTTGTGTLDLDGASTGYRTFLAGVGDGSTAAYIITDGVEWETGTGVVTGGTPDTLSRVAVSASSNGGSKVNWGNSNANERDVFIAPLADLIAFPSGTIMLFQQTAAPIGWTKETTHNDKALRVVTGSASVGGSTAFGTVFGASKTTEGKSLGITEMAAHTHDVRAPFTGGAGQGWAAPSTGPQTISGAALTRGGGSSHDHNVTLDLNYVDLILASKD